MTGVILLSKDDFYADNSGSVAWGPSSDKAWLRHFIQGEIVIVGHETFQTIKDFDGLMCLADKWLVDSRSKVYGVKNAMRFCKDCHEAFPADSNPTINFGGPKTLMKYKPDTIIVHKADVTLGKGRALPDDFFDDYEIESSSTEPEYEVIIYVQKK